MIVVAVSASAVLPSLTAPRHPGSPAPKSPAANCREGWIVERRRVQHRHRSWLVTAMAAKTCRAWDVVYRRIAAVAAAVLL